MANFLHSIIGSLTNSSNPSDATDAGMSGSTQSNMLGNILSALGVHSGAGNGMTVGGATGLNLGGANLDTSGANMPGGSQAAATLTAGMQGGQAQPQQKKNVFSSIASMFGL